MQPPALLNLLELIGEMTNPESPLNTLGTFLFIAGSRHCLVAMCRQPFCCHHIVESTIKICAR